MDTLQQYLRLALSEDRDTFMARAGAAVAGPKTPALPREVKKIWNAEADHDFFKGLTKVHWVSRPEQLLFFADPSNRSREVSVNLFGRGQPLESDWGEVGVVLEGRVTLASNDMDSLYTGYAGSRVPSADSPRSPSASRKRPEAALGWVMPGQETLADKIRKSQGLGATTAGGKDPLAHFILDAGSFDAARSASSEGVVASWRPVGFVMSGVLHMLPGRRGQFLEIIRSVPGWVDLPIRDGHGRPVRGV